MKITPVGRRGRQPTFLAKIGTMPGSVILVKRVRDFEVGHTIEFAELRDLEGCSVGMPPSWQRGIIWLISDNRLFVNRL